MDKIREFCEKNHIRRMALFGSVVTDEFRPDSDVDVIVEFEPDARIGLEFFGMPDELQEIFGRKVDLVTFDGIQRSRNSRRRDRILNSARTIYEAA